MPELPEVETFRRRFLFGNEETPSLVGRRILSADLLWERTVETPSPQAFRTRIGGQTIQEVDRRGKYLLFRLDEDVLALHLRMSGDLLVEAASAPPGKHHRLLINLDNGSRLVFSDMRKFGRAWLTDQVEALLAHLGPEPLDEDFDPQVFYRKLQGRGRQIKPLLLDQTFLAGMGNIYTDEALFYAAIHPRAAASSLSFGQAEKLWEGIRYVLEEGIRRNGSSIDWVYRGGDFQNYFQVYQRTGGACTRCGTAIKRTLVGQRGTHFCPRCQVLGRDDL
jgi:formamidopyrimidine-DNA glycosylase